MENVNFIPRQLPASTGRYSGATGRRFPAVLVAACLCLVLAPGFSFASESAPGKSYGAIASEKPDWFKESFLEFEEDVAEAAASGRRVMLYFHQEGCPYCARLVEENFSDPQIKRFIQQHFDGISLNMWGDREVVSVAGREFTEKTFAAALEVQYTPTLVFLDESGKVALRLNGYYPPADFRAALDYVAGKLESRLSFADYRLEQFAAHRGQLHDEDFFLPATDLAGLVATKDRPLAVYFEAPNCAECTTLHERILSDATTRNLVRMASNVQFNVAAQTQIVAPDGRRLRVRDWASELGIGYTPSVVFFDRQGQEVMRIGAFVKTFHFQSVYAYVLEKAYLDEPRFQRYIAARAERIREAGFDTDIWGYDSFHQ